MAQAVKNVVSKNFISVILPGVGVYALEASHPTFPTIKRAIERKQWARIGHLVNLAKQLSYETHGNVEIKRGVPYYKGVRMEGYLAMKLQEMIRRGERKQLPALLKFSNNLMQNPDRETIKEVLEFLEIAKMPITDDGCFLAYKCVNDDFTDCYSSTVDNSPGQTPAMPRKSVDKSSRNACSSGFHFAALDYIRDTFGSNGRRVVMIKVNPRDVVAIPHFKTVKKGRTWFYEVVKELFTITEAQNLQDHPEMLTTVVNVAKERNKVLKFVLDHPVTKKNIRKRDIKRSTIVKMTLGRLQAMAAKLPAVTTEPVKPSTVLDRNPLKLFREAAGLELAAVAEEIGLTYKAAWAAEQAPNPRQESIDRYLEAIQKLTGANAGLSFPKPSGPSEKAMAATVGAGPVEADMEEENWNESDSDSFGYEYGDDGDEDEDND